MVVVISSVINTGTDPPEVLQGENGGTLRCHDKIQDPLSVDNHGSEAQGGPRGGIPGATPAAHWGVDAKSEHDKAGHREGHAGGHQASPQSSPLTLEGCPWGVGVFECHSLPSSQVFPGDGTRVRRV